MYKYRPTLASRIKVAKATIQEKGVFAWNADEFILHE
jgi:hypothetical protein